MEISANFVAVSGARRTPAGAMRSLQSVSACYVLLPAQRASFSRK
ncbi:hypothetical protein A2U01_0063342, partial [Trifolium medium]|nr:hypothetical protein [Trifolium medium]